MVLRKLDLHLPKKEIEPDLGPGPNVNSEYTHVKLEAVSQKTTEKNSTIFVWKVVTQVGLPQEKANK